MGLIRGVARTAVIAGTATTVSNRVSRRQANKWAAQDQEQAARQAASRRRPGPAGRSLPHQPHLLRTTCLLSFRSLESSKLPGY